MHTNHYLTGALLATFALMGCRSQQLIQDSGSGLASVSVGEIDKTVVPHDKMQLIVEREGREANMYFDREFKDLTFEPGTVLRLQLVLLNDGAPVAKSIEGHEQCAPLQTAPLQAGDNKAKIKVCRVDERGRPTGGLAQSTGEPANLDIETCVVGVNCEEGSVNGRSTDRWGEPELNTADFNAQLSVWEYHPGSHMIITVTSRSTRITGAAYAVKFDDVHKMKADFFERVGNVETFRFNLRRSSDLYLVNAAISKTDEGTCFFEVAQHKVNFDCP